jgi:predicted metal-dependent hydrolase
MARKQPRRKKSSIRLRPTAAEINRAIAAVTSHEAHLNSAINNLEIIIKRLGQVTSLIETRTAQLLKPSGALEREVGTAINKLKATFRDGPVQINESLIRLAQDILQEQIKTILADQIHNLTKELARIAREEVQAEVYTAVREALNDEKALRTLHGP